MNLYESFRKNLKESEDNLQANLKALNELISEWDFVNAVTEPYISSIAINGDTIDISCELWDPDLDDYVSIDGGKYKLPEVVDMIRNADYLQDRDDASYYSEARDILTAIEQKIDWDDICKRLYAERDAEFYGPAEEDYMHYVINWMDERGFDAYDELSYWSGKSENWTIEDFKKMFDGLSEENGINGELFVSFDEFINNDLLNESAKTNLKESVVEHTIDYKQLEKELDKDTIDKIDTVLNHYIKYTDENDDGDKDIIEEYFRKFGNGYVIDWYEGLMSTEDFINEIKNGYEVELIPEGIDESEEASNYYVHGAIQEINGVNCYLAEQGGQGYYFKSEKAYMTEPDSICYISEYSFSDYEEEFGEIENIPDGYASAIPVDYVEKNKVRLLQEGGFSTHNSILDGMRTTLEYEEYDYEKPDGTVIEAKDFDDKLIEQMAYDVFDMVDWQSTGTLADEIEWDETIEAYYNKNGLKESDASEEEIELLKTIVEDLKNEPLIKKYMLDRTWLSGSSTTVYPITVSGPGKDIEIQLDTNKNVFNSLLKKYENKYPLYAGFWKSDGSCPSHLYFKLKSFYNEAEEARQYDGKVQLQSVGKVNAVKGSNLKPGDIIAFNWGYTAKVLDVEPSASGKTVTVTAVSSDTGNKYTRKYGADRLVPLSKREATDYASTFSNRFDLVREAEKKKRRNA